MRIRSARCRQCLDRALTALAVLCVLMMPVQYRGGADLPHPHAVFQFWDSGDSAAAHHHGHAHNRPATGAPVTGAPAPDIPALTEMSPAAERAVGLAMAVLAAIVFLSRPLVRRLPIAAVRIPGSHQVTPDPPPPRAILAPVSRVGI